MNDDEDFSSDTSDDDYVPSDGHVVSEEEGSGEEEDTLDGEQEKSSKPVTSSKSKGKRKRTRQKSDFNSRKRKSWLKQDNNDKDSDESQDKPEDLKEEVKDEPYEKKKADDLWADFMKDVSQTKPKCTPSSGLGALSSLAKPVSALKAASSTTTTATKNSQQASNVQSEKKPEKITITKEYDFAGEVVKITKEVDADCKEAKEALQKQETSKEATQSAGPSLPVLKKTGGGLDNVLGKIGKKQKLSTLEKSKLDWNNFKKKEGIEDELQIHNRGKDGYIERMSFLERTDYRQFEIERSIRMSSSKR